MSQFVKKPSIEVISSSRPQTSKSLKSVNESSIKHQAKSPDLKGTVNTFDSSTYESYSLLPKTLRKSLQSPSSSPSSPSSLNFNPSFKSALEPSDQVPQTDNAKGLPDSSVGIKTEDTVRPTSGPTSQSQQHDQDQNDIASNNEDLLSNKVVTKWEKVALFINDYYKYITNCFCNSHANNRPSDLESQPLLPPSSGNTIVEEGAAETIGFAYFTIFRMSAFLLCLGVFLLIVLTGDVPLLLDILRAVLCHLASSSSNKLFGEDFCPMNSVQ